MPSTSALALLNWTMPKKKLTVITKMHIVDDPDGTLRKKQLDVIVRLLERAHQEAASESTEPHRRPSSTRRRPQSKPRSSTTDDDSTH